MQERTVASCHRPPIAAALYSASDRLTSTANLHATVVAPFTLLVPITGLLSGYLVLGEVITPIEIGGAVLVIAGLIVTLRKSKGVEPAIRLD